MKQADIGLIGLAVMGQNLILNMEEKGFTVAVFNRTVSKVDTFMEGPAKGKNILPAHSIEEFVSKLKTPRRIMFMVKAGPAVDDFISQIEPHLEKGDIIIDGGNSHYPDSQRRFETLKEKGLLFVGAGISGGEEGARHGPSIMPGGNPDAWPHIKDIFQKIAAKASDNLPCCDWVGTGGAGHYVKMVHNGIEYGDMQIICEAYNLLSHQANLSEEELAETFADYNKGKLESYLIEITSKILTVKDEDGFLIVDKILDTAGQKGTGKWTGITALDMNIPLTLIAEAVFARCLSALKEERVEASKIFSGPSFKSNTDKKAFIKMVEDALYASKLISYAQGFTLMRKASDEFKWDLNYGSVALMWREGCIIRSKFLYKIKEAFDQNPNLSNLLLDNFFKGEINHSIEGLRKTLLEGIPAGISLPCFSSALAYFDGYRQERLPANLLQAQRDFFGAHTYERLDKPRGEFFHTNWTGTGGDVSSSSYNA